VDLFYDFDSTVLSSINVSKNTFDANPFLVDGTDLIGLLFYFGESVFVKSRVVNLVLYRGDTFDSDSV